MTPVSTGFADLSNNHHIAMYRLPDGSVDYEVVSLLKASQRLTKGCPVVSRERSDSSAFMMSLSINEALMLSHETGDEIWIVSKVSANGQVYLRRHTDADKNRRPWSPSARTFIKKGAKKISIDPIGRIRPAND